MRAERAFLVLTNSLDENGKEAVSIEAMAEGDQDEENNPAHRMLGRIARALPFVLDPRFEAVIGGMWNVVANSEQADAEKGEEILAHPAPGASQ